MTALWIVGRGRLAHALQRSTAGRDIALLPGRDADLRAHRPGDPPAPILIAARDPAGDAQANLTLAARLARQALDAGWPEDRILHAGSYAAEAPRADPYTTEKRALEDQVARGVLPGRVLRLPILRIEDDRFKAILSEIAWAVSEGLVAPELRLPILSPEALAQRLINLQCKLPPISIVGAQPIATGDLIREVGIIPKNVGHMTARLQLLADYSKSGIDGGKTHYERQMEKSSL